MERSISKIFGVKIDNLDLEEAYQKFITMVQSERTSMIFTPNTEMVMAARKDLDFKDVLISGDLVIPDGIGLIYASKVHKLGLKERVPGIELMEKILGYCNKTRKSVYVLGSKPGIAEKACKNIESEFSKIKIAGFHHGYFSEDDEYKIIDKINEVQPDVLFVALGMGKQEKWIYKHRKILNTKVAIGVGGSIDVWSGNVKRAPKFFQKAGLEWLYRLLREPSRFFRMLVLPKFMIKVFTTRNISK